jgi:flagellar biosynthetic protein FlhB
MMQEVPKADVRGHEPTHFAVALRYDETRMRAPIVVAKGTDLTARTHPRDRRREWRAARRSAAAGARAVSAPWISASEVPAALYVTARRLLTYVYQLKAAVARGAKPPPPPVIH